MKKPTTKHNKLFSVFAVFCILISVGVFLYPTISNLVNQISNINRNVSYTEDVKTMSEQEKIELIDRAREYNNKLGESLEPDSAYKYKKTEDYTSLFDFNDGQIGSIEIPKIDVSLPIYHGTDEKTLQQGAVHLPNTSLPIGEVNTHSVISAHTAFPGKVYFDRLTEMQVGDVFYIKLLDDTFKYKVQEINIVEPSDVSKYKVERDRELVTLSTCYPYAINSHRLLVTGERVKEDKTIVEKEIADTGFNLDYKPLLFVPVPLLVFTIIIFVSKRKKQDKTR